MIDLMATIWPAMAAALLFGAVVAGSTGGPGPSSRVDRLGGALLAALLGALIVASGRGYVAGRAGIWLDIGTLTLAAYLAGCGLGCLLRSWTGPQLGEGA